MQKLLFSSSLLFLMLTSLILLALQIKLLGWILLGIGVVITLLSKNKAFKKDILLIYLSFGILGITPISTDINFPHALAGIPIILTVVVPYLISRYIFKDYHIRFKFDHKRNWAKAEILYIFLTALTVYAVWPWLFRVTGVYQNWAVELNPSYLVRFFFAMNLTGIWDEFFFISTVYGLLRRHLSFPLANIAQTVVFTSVLYALGFNGWSFLAVVLFALLQGKIYEKTQSLFYLLAIHVTTDILLTLILINAHYPHIFPIFLIK